MIRHIHFLHKDMIPPPFLLHKSFLFSNSMGLPESSFSDSGCNHPRPKAGKERWPSSWSLQHTGTCPFSSWGTSCFVQPHIRSFRKGGRKLKSKQMSHLQSFLSLWSSKLQQRYLPDHVSISTYAVFRNMGAGDGGRNLCAHPVGGSGRRGGRCNTVRQRWFGILFGMFPKLSWR